jgi:hypothetical protein
MIHTSDPTSTRSSTHGRELGWWLGRGLEPKPVLSSGRWRWPGEKERERDCKYIHKGIRVYVCVCVGVKCMNVHQYIMKQDTDVIDM